MLLNSNLLFFEFPFTSNKNPSIEAAALSITKHLAEEEDLMFSVCTYAAETDQALNLVEGERLFIIGKVYFFLHEDFMRCMVKNYFRAT